MDINRNNYELYLVDYAEGMLSPKQKQLVEAFLLANPDIQEEFDLFNTTTEPLPETSFTAKKELKKIPFTSSPIDTEFFNQQCVASIENLLNPEEESLFQASLSDDAAKQKEYALFQKTKLTIEELQFDEKILLLTNDATFTVTEQNFTAYCIACHEGWLSHNGLLALNKYIANYPDNKKEFDFIGQLKLTPDYTISYPDKRKIKRFTIAHQRPVKYLTAAASIAAVVTIGLFLWNNPGLKQQMQSATSYQIQQTINPIENNVVSRTETEKEMSLNTIVKANKTNSITNNLKNNNHSTQNNNNRKTTEVETIDPIGIDKVNCNRCTRLVDNQELIVKDQSRSEAKEIVSFYNEPTTSNSLLSNVVNSSLKGLSHLSNGKIKVNEIQSNRTNLTLSTKYLAFSTTIKTGK